MSTPGMQPGGGGNPLDALNGLFGGSDKTIYPPAPPGYRYQDVSIPYPAPPGYAVQTMRQIAASGGGIPGGGTALRQRPYQFGAHTNEGIRERAIEADRLRGAAQELRMLQNPGYKPRYMYPQSGQSSLSQTGSNPVQAMWDRVDAAKSSGAPSAPDALSRSSLAPPMGSIPIPPPSTPSQTLAAQQRKLGLGNTVQNILSRLPQSGQAGTTPREDAYPTGGALPGLSPSVAPPSDTTATKLDDSFTGRMKQMWQQRQTPQILQDIWQRMNTPPGPAFDPSTVDLSEQRYDPLPTGEEEK